MIEQANLLAGELSNLRQDIHRHPELGFREFRTAALVADTLREIGGYTIHTGVGRTGVVAELGSGSGPTIAIRADMDALPIIEDSRQPYVSQNPGIMHACGHDAHTAILLGAAHLLRQSYEQDNWQGTVRLLFQPSEESFDENGISGATAMIQDGALQGIDAVIALHVSSDKPAGECRFSDGFSLAAVDSFDGWIRGDGGHGAYPHLGSDPIFILSQILSALYAIPSRNINPLQPVVVSLGQVHAGAASNVIPNEVRIQGTIRSLDPDIRQKLWLEIERCFKVAEVMGGSGGCRIHPGYPAMNNSAEVNEWLRRATADLIGEDAIVREHFGMGAEDFAYMTQAAKGAMFMLGAATPDGVLRNHHTSIFDIDESVMPKGAAILAETARRFVTGQVEE